MKLRCYLNKMKYCRLRLTDKVYSERPKRDLQGMVPTECPLNACGIVKAHEGVELKLRPYFLTLGA